MIGPQDFAVVLPELILVGGAILLLLLDAFFPSLMRRFSFDTATAVIMVALFALWRSDKLLPPAFGVLFNDAFSVFVGLVILLSALLVVMLSWGYMEERRLPPAEYLVGLLICTAGMLLMTRSSNLIMIFVALEVLSLSLYLMIGYDRANTDGAESAMKYFILGSFASAIFMFGAVLVYGQTGSMTVVPMSNLLQGRIGVIGLVLLVTGMGFKISMAPFHLWTPDVYQGAPPPVAAFLASASKVAAVATLLRIVYPAFALSGEMWLSVWPWLAGLTMFLGNIVALSQEDVKRILAYSSIAHVGYVLMALAVGGDVGIHAVLFYVLTYSIATVGAFGVVAAMPGDERRRVDLYYVRGLSRSHPVLAALFALFLLSLAGVPPLVGFAGKFVAFRAALVAGMHPLAIFAALNAAAAVYYYLRIIIRMYMEPRAEPLTFRVPQVIYASLVVAAVGVILVGIFPGGVLDMIQMSARAFIMTSFAIAGL